MFLHISQVSGLLLPIIIFTGIGLAIAVSPWFSWEKNALSDLGIAPNSAILFNGSMILGGVCMFVFSLGLLRETSQKLGIYLLSMSSLTLIGIGLFPETMILQHFLSSAAFFILIVVSMLVIGLTFRNQNRGSLVADAALLFSIIALFSTIFLLLLPGIAITEALVCFPAFVWCFITSITISPGEQKHLVFAAS